MKCPECGLEMGWARKSEQWWCSRCERSRDGPPPGPTPEQEEKLRTAATLVKVSHALGWGGLGVLFVGSPVCGFATHALPAAGVVAGLGILSAIAGAIVGQVGRGMQGRVI